MKSVRMQWSDFETFMTDNGINPSYYVKNGHYYLFANTGDVESNCVIYKQTPAPPGSGQEDFENNWKDDAVNRRVQKFAQALEDDNLSLDGQGFSFTATKDSTTSHTFKLTKKYCLKGGYFYSQNASWGDYCKVELSDEDNLLGSGAGTILGTYVNKWYVPPNGQELHIDDVAISELPVPNLYLKITYTSVGTVNDVDGVVNIICYEKI